MDLVRILDNYCQTKGFNFEYGSKSHLNLLDSGLDETKIHLLLFPVRRVCVPNTHYTAIAKQVFTGKFLLVKHSNFDLHYFKERNQSDADSKYTINIEPLLGLHNEIAKELMSCGLEFELENWSCIDAIDVLDSNNDGIWCDFKINQDVK